MHRACSGVPADRSRSWATESPGTLGRAITSANSNRPRRGRLSAGTFYAKRTRLSQAAVDRYRRTPVTGWSRASDRRIGSTIHGLDRTADDPEVPKSEWRRAARSLLDVIGDFVRGVVDAVASFVERLADALVRVLDRMAKVLGRLAPIVKEMAAMLAGSSAGRPLARRE